MPFTQQLVMELQYCHSALGRAIERRDLPQIKVILQDMAKIAELVARKIPQKS